MTPSDRRRWVLSIALLGATVFLIDAGIDLVNGDLSVPGGISAVIFLVCAPVWAVWLRRDRRPRRSA